MGFPLFSKAARRGRRALQVGVRCNLPPRSHLAELGALLSSGSLRKQFTGSFALLEDDGGGVNGAFSGG